MAGTPDGGIKARDKNYTKQEIMVAGEAQQIKPGDFYKRIGSIGGKLGKTGGFYDRELASRAGAIGGRRSRRGRQS